VTFIAGPAAERRFIGRWNHTGADHDYHTAMDLASYVTRSAEQTNAFMAWCNAQARDLVNTRWGMIEAFTRVLLEERDMAHVRSERRSSNDGSSAGTAARSCIRSNARHMVVSDATWAIRRSASHGLVLHPARHQC